MVVKVCGDAVSDCVGDSVWVTVYVALCGLRCVSDDVGDGIWVTVR